jgi:hypothetical protein
MVEARDGKTWAAEFARFPALSAVVRDDGSGLGKGLKLERARRREENQPDLEDSLDVFHTVREGSRALRKSWGAATRALDRAEEAQKKLYSARDQMRHSPSREISVYRRRMRQGGHGCGLSCREADDGLVSDPTQRGRATSRQ